MIGIVATLGLHAPAWAVLLGALLLHLHDHEEAEDPTQTPPPAQGIDKELSDVVLLRINLLAAVLRLILLGSAFWAFQGASLLLASLVLGTSVYLDFTGTSRRPTLLTDTEEYTYVPLSSPSDVELASLSRALFGVLAVLAAGQHWPFLALLLVATAWQLPDSDDFELGYLHPDSPLAPAEEDTTRPSTVKDSRLRPWKRRAWVRTAHGRSAGKSPLPPLPNSTKELAWTAARATLACVGMPAGESTTSDPTTLPAGDGDGAGPPPASTTRTHEWIQVVSHGVVVDLRHVLIGPPELPSTAGAIAVPVTFGDNIAASYPPLPVSALQSGGGGSPAAGNESDGSLGSDKEEDIFSTGQPKRGDGTLCPSSLRRTDNIASFLTGSTTANPPYTRVSSHAYLKDRAHPETTAWCGSPPLTSRTGRLAPPERSGSRGRM